MRETLSNNAEEVEKEEEEKEATEAEGAMVEALVMGVVLLTVLMRLGAMAMEIVLESGSSEGGLSLNPNIWRRR